MFNSKLKILIELQKQLGDHAYKRGEGIRYDSFLNSLKNSAFPTDSDLLSSNHTKKLKRFNREGSRYEENIRFLEGGGYIEIQNHHILITEKGKYYTIFGVLQTFYNSTVGSHLITSIISGLIGLCIGYLGGVLMG